MRQWLHLACALLLAAGCSSSSAPPLVEGTDAGDAATAFESSTSVDSAIDGPKACNTLANTALPVTTNQVAADPPVQSGGAVASGTYALTDVTIYTGPNGPVGPGGMAQTTLLITGNTVQVTSTGEPPTRTVSLSTGGTSFTSTDTCPDSTVLHGTYTATPSTFAIQIDGGTDDAGARTVVETFTRQ